MANLFSERFAGTPVRASSPQWRFAEGAAAIDGTTLEAAEAHGKQMFLRFSGNPSGERWLRVHLGIYGMWRFAGPGLEKHGRRTRQDRGNAWPPEPIGQVRLRLVAGPRVADLSGPAGLELLDDAGKAAAQAGMGDDPLRPDADPGRAVRRLRASRSTIAQLLMRQDIIAGIGNIFRAELLFRAGMEPHRPGRSLSEAEARGLWDDFAALLPPSVAAGRILTTRPEHRKHPVYVSHRAGKPCYVCGDAVQKEDMAGRVLYWCPTCQPPAGATE